MKIFLQFTMVIAVVLITAGSMWAQGVPHPLYVNVQNGSDISPATGDLTFEAWLTIDPSSVLTQSSTGCFYSVPPGVAVECGNFATAWTAGDVVHIEVEQTSTGDVGTGEFTLNNDNFQMFAGAAGIIIAPIPLPSEVWVDNNYTLGSCGGHSWEVDAFDNITDGIAAVAEAGTVNVAAGSYDELIYIDKTLTLLGPNFDKSGTDNTRVSEAIITFPSGLTEDYYELIVVGPVDSWTNVNDVVIKGFTIDGYSTETFEAAGIIGNSDGLVVENNIIKNFNWGSVLVSSYVDDGGSWDYSDYNESATIKHNYIHNDDIYDDFVESHYPWGIYLQGTYGEISNNVVEGVRLGIQIQPYNHPNNENLTGTVSGNTFEGYQLPVWFNYSENTNANWSISSNTLIGIAAPPGLHQDEWSGFRISTCTADGVLDFSGNTINYGTADATSIVALKKWGNVIAGMIDLDNTFADNTWERCVVISDGTNILEPAITDVYFYADIQAAINAADPDDVIDVAAGTYELTAQMDIDKGVSIVGQGSVTIKANNSSWSTVNGYKHLLGIYAGTQLSPITISNITMDCNIECYGLNTYGNAYGILDNVTINNSVAAGLTVNGSTIIATGLNTSNNSWGAVNVDPGSGVTDPSVFTLNSGTLGEDNQIWSDRSYVTPTVTVTVNAAGYDEYVIGDGAHLGTHYWTNRELTNCASITKNGETTTYSTIQSAIDAATTGDVINVAAGSYEEQVILTPGVDITLIGAGRDVVTWIAPAEGTCLSGNMGGYTGDMNYDISGFTFNCRALASSAHGTGVMIKDASSGSLTLAIHDNKFIEDLASGDDTHWATSIWACHNRAAVRDGSGNAPVLIYNNIDETVGGMTMSNTRAFDIYANTFDGCSNAIYNGHGCPDSDPNLTFGDHHIYGNTFKNASDALHPGFLSPAIDWQYYGAGAGTHLPSVIEDNLFEDNGTAMRFVMGTDMTYPAHDIVHNKFVNNGTGLIVEGTFATTLDANCNWWGTPYGPDINLLISGTVDYSTVLLTPVIVPGPGYNCGTAWPTPVWNSTQDIYYATIQTAIDDADAGDVIEVAPGTYTEDVEVTQSVTIIGAGPTTIVQPTATANVAFTVSVDDVTIQDLKITHPTILTFGVSLVTGATTGFTLQDVDITNIGGATATANGHGIYIYNSFSDLTVTDCFFSSGYQGAASRGIGILAPNNLTLIDFDISGSTFEYLFVGVYLRSAIDGMDVTTSTFGPFELDDCAACVAGVYIGDGTDDNFDIENITVTGNTFTNYGRGVYVWNYANNATIRNFDVYDNTFTNTIWSSAVRFIAGLGDDEGVTMGVPEGPINVYDNTFTQASDCGGNVFLIGFRAYCELAGCEISVDNNDITFSGGPYADAMSGIGFLPFEGPFTNTIVSNNTLNGGNTSGAGIPPSSGIGIIHKSADYWPSDILDIDITNNEITAFDNGINIYDATNSVYGGLPAGSILDINNNDLSGNNLYAIQSGPGETLTATCNWWGTTDPVTIASYIDGPVGWSPFLTAEGGDCDGWAPMNLTTGLPYTTIQAAIDAASDNDEIFIPSGTYDESPVSKGNLIFSFGGSPGCVTVTDLTFQSTDIVDVDIWGATVCTEYDQTTVTGTLTANGATMNVALNGYMPLATATFPVFNYGTMAGTFTSGSGMGNFSISYSGTQVVLTTLQGIDIAIHEIGCAGFEVVVRPNADLDDNFVTNMQFTIQYPEGVTLTNKAPLLPLATQGSPAVTGFQTITYAAINLSNTNWDEGDEIVVLTFNHDQSGTGTGDFIIWPGTTLSYTYYAEYKGSDVTGNIYANAEDSWLDGCPVWNETQDLWYYQIQAAIDEANTSSTDIIDVYYKTRNLGIYPEELYIDRAVDLRGPNYGVNPNTESRNPEASIQYPTSTGWSLLFIDGETVTSDVSVNGFEFNGVDGDDTDLIFIAGAENVTIKDNILKNFTGIGIWCYQGYYDGTGWVVTYPSGAVVSDNHISNPDFYSNGSIFPNMGIYLQGVYGSVTGNVVEDVLGGCQIQPYNHPNTSLETGEVSGNTFKASRNALWYNNSSNANADWLFSGNTLSGIPYPTGYTPGADWYGEPSDIWYGFAINGNSYGEVAFVGNTIEKGTTTIDAYGIRYVHGYQHAPETAITFNAIDNLEYGVYLPDNLVNISEIVINNNSISGSTEYGVYNGTAGSNLDATCNWWGSANINDVAAKVTGDVVYAPFLITDDEDSPSAYPNGFDPLGPCASAISMKVWLQGPYDVGTHLMKTDINGELPTDQPFNQAPWNYAGTETLPSPLPAEVVDWVLVELRTDASTSFEMVAGLLYEDGSVVANFVSADQSTPYYVVIYQRNHMPVMTATAITFEIFTFPYDFTLLTNLYENASTPNAPAWLLETGVWGMIAGDVTANGLLQYSGPGNDRGPILAAIIAGGGINLNSTIENGYWFEDVNMDDWVKYSGGNNDRLPIIGNINVLSGNLYLNSIYTSLVPGAYTGTKDARFNDGPINIEMQNGQIVLTPNENISNGLMDNIQFTLAWKTGDQDASRAVESFASDCGLLPQGETIEVNGESHQVFVSIDFTELPQEWIEEQSVTLMSFNNMPEGRVWIADNSFTEDNNAMYYVSVWGEDLTGEIKNEDVTSTNSFDLRVYPNPVNNGILNVEIPSEIGSQMYVKVIDMQGNLQYDKNQNADSGVLQINVSQLKAGAYMIMLIGENEMQQARFIIAR